MKAEDAVCKYLDCSTNCLPEHEYDRVEGKVNGLVTESTEYGDEVWVYPLDDSHEDLDAFIHKDMPALAAVLDLARSLGCRWVNFDRDAETIDELPSWEW